MACRVIRGLAEASAARSELLALASDLQAGTSALGNQVQLVACSCLQSEQPSWRTLALTVVAPAERLFADQRHMVTAESPSYIPFPLSGRTCSGSNPRLVESAYQKTSFAESFESLTRLTQLLLWLAAACRYRCDRGSLASYEPERSQTA